ncbi:MAG: XRE family transcriptional regulator [Rhodobacteraceae bacterium]|nr:XRE family transcriptional regulator [Paracoccaceae bacterium]
MKNTPYGGSPGTRFIAKRVRDLKHKKSYKEITHEVGFVSANIPGLLKSGANKIPLDRVPASAKALKAGSALLMHLVLEESVGVTAATAILKVFGTAVSENEKAGSSSFASSQASASRRSPLSA